MPPRKYETEEKTSIKEGKREYMKFYMRDYRKHQRNKKENRLGYLESEVARLQKNLEVAQRGSAMP